MSTIYLCFEEVERGSDEHLPLVQVSLQIRLSPLLISYELGQVTLCLCLAFLITKVRVIMLFPSCGRIVDYMFDSY